MQQFRDIKIANEFLESDNIWEWTKEKSFFIIDYKYSKQRIIAVIG